MSEVLKKSKKVLRIGMMIVLSVILIFMILLATVLYANWSAENEAKAFCNAVDTGSNISLAIKKFETKIGKKETLHYEFQDGEGHRFLFPGLMFDKAQCTVQSDREGKVLAKVSEMVYD